MAVEAQHDVASMIDGTTGISLFPSLYQVNTRVRMQELGEDTRAAGDAR